MFDVSDEGAGTVELLRVKDEKRAKLSSKKKMKQKEAKERRILISDYYIDNTICNHINSKRLVLDLSWIHHPSSSCFVASTKFIYFISNFINWSLSSLEWAQFISIVVATFYTGIFSVVSQYIKWDVNWAFESLKQPGKKVVTIFLILFLWRPSALEDFNDFYYIMNMKVQFSAWMENNWKGRWNCSGGSNCFYQL